MRELIILGKWTENSIDKLLEESSGISDIGKRIDTLSGQFIGLEYKESTLIGDKNTKEVFICNLAGMDCFTFLDYIEAMRISGSFAEFKNNLKRVRYHKGKIAYEGRNHFFTDWREFNPDLVEDITGQVSKGKGKVVKKVLNLNDDGTCFLPGILCRERQVVYVPVENIDDTVVENLRTGDYIGIYSEKPGLDVSHVGIAVKDKNNVLFRHASKNSKRVVDEDFREYIKDKSGIIVLRPKEFHP